MQSGWYHGLFAWLLGISLMLLLRAFEVISDPWQNVTTFVSGQEFSTALAPWTMLAGGLSMLMGLCISPLLPFKTQVRLGNGEGAGASNAASRFRDFDR